MTIQSESFRHRGEAASAAQTPVGRRTAGMAGKACGVGMNITSDQPFTVQLMHEGRSAHR
jgi:hypothetical protein